MKFATFTKMAVLTSFVTVSLMGATVQAQGTGGGPHVKVFDGASGASEAVVNLPEEPARVIAEQESSDGPSDAFFVRNDATTTTE